MDRLKKLAETALEEGISPNSRIVNITHVDLDGIVSTINLMNYFKEMIYVQRNYDNVNQYLTEIIFKDNCTFKNIDYIIVTDISLDPEVVIECRERGIGLIILDHHETAYGLNEFDNCYVDEGEELSGAGVTLEFIKYLGYDSGKLDKLNDIANQFDLYLFKGRPELRKFDVLGNKRSLAEMTNTLFFSTRDKDEFIERWIDGWGKGFNKQEIEMIKTEQQLANDTLEKIKGNPQLEVHLDEKVVLILTNAHLVYTGEYYLDKANKDVIVFYNHKTCKFSGRASDSASVNIGKIFKTLKDKKSFVLNGGGHEKAGGGNLSSNEHLEEFIELFMKLYEFYK